MSEYNVGDICKFDAWHGSGICIIIKFLQWQWSLYYAEIQGFNYEDMLTLTCDNIRVDELIMAIDKDKYETNNV